MDDQSLKMDSHRQTPPLDLAICGLEKQAPKGARKTMAGLKNP
jgi:hypothetical protein